MKKLLLLLLCTCMQAAFAQSGKIDWKADLEFLTKELPEKHCNFFTARSKGEFVSGIEAIKAESERLTDFQVALKTQQLIARFGDSHTMLQFFQLIDQTQILPLGTLWVSDGLYITKTTPENKEILGLRIVAINDTPIATVIDSLSTLFTIDNQAIVKSIVPETVMSLQALEHFGFADSRQVKLMLSDGKTQVVKPIHPDNAFVNFRPDSLAFATANRKVLFTSRYFPEDRIYYMLYNKCHSRELAAERGDAEAAQKLPSFEAFTRKAFETLNDKPVDKLIFDIALQRRRQLITGNRICRTTRTSPQTTPASCGICGAGTRYILLGDSERHGFQTADQCRFRRRRDGRKAQPFRGGPQLSASEFEGFGQLFNKILQTLGKRDRDHRTRHVDRDEFRRFQKRSRPRFRMDKSSIAKNPCGLHRDSVYSAQPLQRTFAGSHFCLRAGFSAG